MSANWIRAQAEAGFPSLAGSKVTAKLRIKESVLLSEVRSRGWKLEELNCKSGNLLELKGLKWKRWLPSVSPVFKIVGLDPMLKLRMRFVTTSSLASGLVDFISWLLNDLRGHVRLEGNDVEIDLGSMPEVSRYSKVWKGKLVADLSTTPGVLVLNLDWNV